MLQFKDGILTVVDEKLLKRKLTSCQVKHYNKLNYNDFKNIYDNFTETPRYIFQQLQVTYWKYFEHTDINKFKSELVSNILISKRNDNSKNFKEILNELVRNV